MLAQLRAAYPAVLLVDTGNLAQDGPHLDVVLGAYHQMGYEAAAVGPWDARLGDYFFARARETQLPLLSASLDRPGVRPKLIKQFGRFRVGLTATAYGSRSEADQNRVIAVLRELRAECDLVALLSQWNLYWDKEFLDRPDAHGLVDVLIGNAGAAYLTEALEYQGVQILPTSLEGRRIHICEVLFDERKHPQIRVGSRDLGAEVEPDPAVQALVDQYRRSQAAQVRVEGDTLGPEKWGFISAENCHACHPAQYAAWRDSRHAHAVRTLQRGQRLVPECLKCHSELFLRTGKFAELPLEASGVQCVTCHTDVGETPRDRPVGQAHTDEPKQGNISRGGSEEVCLRCHVSEHSPRFRYQTFRERIKHWK